MEHSPQTAQALDSFPYRHRVSDLMASPLVTLDGMVPLEEAARWMVDHAVSSVVVLGENQHPLAILTERDLLRAVARHGATALTQPINSYASSPVATIRAEAFIYVAMGRMSRLKIRHLVCVDARGHALGMITAGALLAQRAGDTLRLGDQSAAAASPNHLLPVRSALPGLARALLDDDVPPLTIASVMAGVLRDITRRVAQLVEMELANSANWGPPPVPYSVMILNDGGRGEVLLNAQPMTAIIFEGVGEHFAWYEEFSRRLGEGLYAAGYGDAVHDPHGGALALRPWRTLSLTQWEEALGQWLETPATDLQAGIEGFFDYVTVHGDIALAGTLRRVALGRARRSLGFLKTLAEHMAQGSSALGFLGGFKTSTKGRVDLYSFGLTPLVQTARILALHCGVAETGTLDRAYAICNQEALVEDDLEGLSASLTTLTDVILQQQLKDIERGLLPTFEVEVSTLSGFQSDQVKDALRCADRFGLVVRDRLMDMVPVPLPGA